MRQLIFGFLITCLFLQLLVLPVSAQPVTADDARAVAQNWIALKIQQQGNWSGSPTAQIGEIQEFKQGDRVIGYFCPVNPKGFLVISLRRELAPVKAYSDTSNLDPDANDGLTDLIKLQMADILDTIEQKAGPVASVSSAEVTPLMEFNYLGSWDVLDTNASAFQYQFQVDHIESNYQQGGTLLTTQWHQFEPYYNEVPAPPSSQVCTNPHCTVGCVATAGAQIMRYWSWPPYGVGSPYSDTIDWPHLANQYIWDAGQSRWEDENGNPLTQVHLDAAAKLSHDVGTAVGMVYCDGSCESSANTDNMEGVYENNFRYSTASNRLNRNDCSASEWFTNLKEQFNRNWPIQYRVEEHSIVGDGWRESYVGTTLHREYHMVYGWRNTGSNTWYTMDGLPLGGIDIEYIVRDIYPAPALGSSLSGTYNLQEFPYRYFDQDTSGDSATFSAGQYLQFLPGVVATCNSGTGSSIRFEGSSSANTELFTKGDPSKGMRIHAGTLKLNPGGSIWLP